MNGVHVTVAELIFVLDQVCEGEDRDSVEVRLAMQPNWPFEYTIGPGPDITIVEIEENESQKKVIYLPEGYQVGHLPTEAAVALGWRTGSGEN